jgi:hypothetical protein
MGWLILALALLVGGPAGAAMRSCGAAKLKSVSDVVAAKLACHVEAAASGSPVSATCLAAADVELTSAFAAAEAAGGCALTADATAVAGEIDSFVAAAVGMLRLSPGSSACDAAKLDATGSAARYRVLCHRRVERKGTDVAEKCVNRGRADVAESFARAEAAGGCAAGGSAGAVADLTDDWCERIAALTRPTRRVSVSSSARAASRPSTRDVISSIKPDISADGRVIVFNSNAEDLVAGDDNGLDIFDILARDVIDGTTEMVTVSTTGAQADADPPGYCVVSADGRYVAFDSWATMLVPADTNSRPDVFVRDRVLGTTERVSVDSNGAEADGRSQDPTISADGRYVAFDSGASNLVPGDTTSFWQDVFVRDRQAGTTERLSVTAGGIEGDAASYNPTLSADGAWVAFWSDASNLVPGDAPFTSDVLIVERATHAIELVSVTWDGASNDAPLGVGPYGRPAVSDDGRFVAFNHGATNIVPDDTNGVNDVFVRDRVLGTTERVSVGVSGAEANGPSIFPSISSDGRFVAFESDATNLVAGDTNGVADVFVRDVRG